MPKIALATTAFARPLDEDFAPLAEALRGLGAQVEDPGWDDAGVDWSSYSLVLMRATWNYHDDLTAFLAWADHVARSSRLCNPPALVRWNTHKRYLLELERAGVPVIPTTVTEPDAAWTPPAAAEYVVKPAVGAGSRGARRCRAVELAAARTHARELQAAGKALVTQPYLESVDSNGETALIWFDGEFSHAIRKGPLLTPGGGATAALFAPESITARAAAADELEVGRRALAAIPGGAPLYARVDLIRDGAGQPRVLELELTEPSLFFAYAPGSAERFARRVLARAA
ncbi:MAG: hypothetical protein O9284_17650 [Steroidobacteraceae bacterium]|jgi:O-ureido-D-serine cyclo-ligase|nr:hypothetical protein [Steroidobacteraceae bacterium]